ncbi:hypothetical protein EOM39_04330, partial [Candidatus Gracilibacteria bacterium]|nr:hypothetical protein [Candidatus Gracilibacteria bacterium]
YIKQVIREYNKNEVERKIPEDIGSSTEFLEAFKNDKDGKLTESLKKFMAKLVGKEVKDIFKDGNLGLNTIVRSTFDSDTGSAETINKPYLEKLLKEKGVLKKNSGELNIYKVQELLDD